MKLTEIVASNINSLRTLRGMSQAALAKKVNLSVSYVSMLERGAREGTLSTIEAFAKAFKVPALAMFTAPQTAVKSEAVAFKSDEPKKTKTTKAPKVKAKTKKK